jgi:hypothetical protein
VRTLGAQNVNGRSQNDTDGFRATRYAQEGDEFLDTVVTGDETWGFHHTPESKQQSLQWRHTHSPRHSHLAGLWIGAAISNTQIKPVLPLLNEHGSQVKDQGRRQCCYHKHKNFPIGLQMMYPYFPDTPSFTHQMK